ncbi:E3 ubiquitin-protein ligase TRIM9-like isoform X2 [Asterias amurensis]|uniref:E3 ubiquitin-protein ligase TRIM9-like isoform X2 n=1 Tax=Asterias amurensis TaxID=7602 RepID=UPI003AB3CCFA
MQNISEYLALLKLRSNVTGERLVSLAAMMEQELSCPVCRGLYNAPIMLPCAHNICLNCAHTLQTNGGPTTHGNHHTHGHPEYLDYGETDRLSEADSGVGFSGYAASAASSSSNSSSASAGYPSIHVDALRVVCPQCHRSIYLDETGVLSLPRNRVLEAIVSRYAGQAKNSVVKCELCEGDAKDATVYCEQCEVFYCTGCRENCHPARGPLAKHSLIPPVKGKIKARAKAQGQQPGKASTCTEHNEENLSMYCILCKLPVCYLCLNEGKHVNHDVKALGAMAKTQKAELSQTLTSLTEKARQAKDFLVHLKEKECTVEFEASLVAKFDELIEALKRRKELLIRQASEIRKNSAQAEAFRNVVQREREFKTKMIKNHIGQCSCKLKQTTGLLEYAIEVMKEQDPASFLMVSGALINRVRNTEMSWKKEMILEHRVDAEFDLTLDSGPVLRAIERLNFKEMKVPDPPIIMPENCSAENNSVTIAWQSHPSSWVEGYVLELDDGNNGEFREVYYGRESICTVDGLHFDTTYNARIKAYNHAGEGDYSESICLQTAEVAWFQPDPRTAHPDIIFTNDNMTLTCNTYDERVTLGNVGFSKGVHYWEITIDRYDNHPDPAFGVARFDTAKDMMLGKDDKSWSMYVDNNRSWFIHNNAHADRTEGGIDVGSVVGVLLDLNKHTLRFYINDSRQGPVAFTGLKGVFFPAISLNRNTQVTFHPGLEIPTDCD